MKENKPLSREIKEFLKTIGLYFLSALVIGITGMLLVELWFPKQIQTIPFDMKIIYFKEFPIPMVILWILSIGLTFGWVFHGVGFKLIEVNK